MDSVERVAGLFYELNPTFLSRDVLSSTLKGILTNGFMNCSFGGLKQTRIFLEIGRSDKGEMDNWVGCLTKFNFM